MPLEPEFDIDPWIVRQEPKTQAWIVSSSRQTYINENREAFNNALRKGLFQTESWLILDLTLVLMTGSDTLRMVVETLRDARRRAIGFVIILPKEGTMREVFLLAGLDSVLDLFAEMDEAIQYINEQ